MTRFALVLLALMLAFGAAGQTPESPQWIFLSGISFDSFGQQASTVHTAAVKLTEFTSKNLPMYQQTTIETALFSIVNGKVVGAPQTAGTLRAGICQVGYQTASKIVSLGGCTDMGLVKAGNEVTLGSITGSGFLSIDIGAKLSKGKFHAFLVPTYRMIAISNTQVKASYALRIGTGF